MTTLSIRNISEEDHRALQMRAAQRGISIEAEARAILHQALRSVTDAGSVRRKPPESIAGKGRTLGDLIGPLVDESDWNCLQ